MSRLAFYIIGFMFLLAFDTMGQISFKMTAEEAMPLASGIDWLLRVLATPWVYVAICGYLGAFFTWMTLLRRAPVGPAFAAAHMEVVSVMIASYFIFGEKPDAPRLIGAALIICGIITLAFAEKQEEEKAAMGQFKI